MSRLRPQEHRLLLMLLLLSVVEENFGPVSHIISLLIEILSLVQGTSPLDQLSIIARLLELTSGIGKAEELAIVHWLVGLVQELLGPK